VTRSLQNVKRSKHRALESHHLLGADKVITPDLNDLALELLERRAIIEKTLQIEIEEKKRERSILC
jgi:hypothetical protein